MNEDFLIRDCGSIILMRPLTEIAVQFVEDNIDLEPWQDINEVAIEPRYFPEISNRLDELGYKVRKV